VRRIATSLGLLSAGWALAVLLVSGTPYAETDALFVSFDGTPFMHPTSGLVVDRSPEAPLVRVRNEKHGFRLTLPESGWTFRTDRWPLEVTDTEYFITVTPVRDRRSEKQHLTRTLKQLKKQSNLMVGRASIEKVQGRLVLQYYSQSVAGSSGSPTSLVDWNYRTCVDGSPAMVELHVVRNGTHEGPPAGSDSTIRRIVDSLEPVVSTGE